MWVAACAVAVSAIAFYFCTGFNHVWFAAWIAPIPVLALAFRTSRWLYRWTPFAAYLLGTAHVFGYLHLFAPVWVVITELILLAGVFQLCASLARFSARRLPEWAAVWTFPAAWIIYEFLFASLTSNGTAFNYGYSQLDFLPVLQIASVTGIWAISFTVMLFASIMALVWTTQRIIPLTPAILFVIAVFAVGLVRLRDHPGGGPALTVGMVTADAGLGASWRTQDPQRAMSVANEYSDRIERLAARGAQLVVLPEKFLGVTPADQKQVYSIFSDSAREAHAMVIAGFNFIGIHPPRNIAVVFAPDGHVVLTYDKHHMLPGPETGYLVGEQPAFFSIDGHKCGVEICKDLDFPAWSRRYGRQDIQFLAVPAWDFVVDAYLHGRMATLRGVETDLPSSTWRRKDCCI